MTMGSHAIVPKTNITDPRTRILVSNRVARYCERIVVGELQLGAFNIIRDYLFAVVGGLCP